MSTKPPSYCQNLSWKRASEIFKDGFELYGDDLQAIDIEQGALGTCYFLSVIESLINDPEKIHMMFYNKKKNA